MHSINSFSDYQQVYQYSIEQAEQFWAEVAQAFYWHKQWDKVLEWDFTKGDTQWFINAKLNITENCLDRHLETLADKTALIWEPNNPAEANRIFTYKQVHAEVCKTANGLKALGVKKGDRVCIYMPMVPELTFAILACARIGAIHSVVFAGFSAQSLSDRINDSQCKILISADGAYRGPKIIALKEIADEALASCPSIEKCVVLQRTNEACHLQAGRDIWWHHWLSAQDSYCEAESMDSEDPLFILYTSGSTGKPKGVVHSTAGYMVYAAYSFKTVFDLQPGQVHFCTADIGWITGHSYILYAPLLNGSTTVLFEGLPTYPDHERFWQIIEKHKVNIFYTAPTAIRSLMAYGNQGPDKYRLRSLKVIGSVGEPINEEAWHWYNIHVGKNNCPLVDTWWQTENGGILISPLAHITPTKPGFASFPLPGVQPVLLNNKGEEIFGNNVEGNLCIKFPWPGIIRSTWGDHERCIQNYFSTYPGYYFTGDGARRDEDGYYRITGRVDDVMNISGHRIGTAEVEAAINQHTGN